MARIDKWIVTALVVGVVTLVGISALLLVRQGNPTTDPETTAVDTQSDKREHDSSRSARSDHAPRPSAAEVSRPTRPSSSGVEPPDHEATADDDLATAEARLREYLRALGLTDEEIDARIAALTVEQMESMLSRYEEMGITPEQLERARASARGEDWTDPEKIKKLVAEDPDRTSFDLEYAEMTKESLLALADLARLENVALSGIRGLDADAIAELLKNASGVRTLMIRRTLSDVDELLVQIAHQDQLEYLFVSGGSISDRGLTAIARMTRLRHLIFDSMRSGRGTVRESLDGPVISEAVSHVTVEGITALKQLVQLETLDLGGFYISATSSNVDVAALRQAMVGVITELPQLQDLGLKHWRLTAEQITAILPTLRRLKRLDIYGVAGAGVILENLDESWQLEALAAATITEEQLRRVVSLPLLRDLQFFGYSMRGEAFQLLSALTKLETLQVGGSNLFVTDLNFAMERMTRLQNVVIVVDKAADAAQTLHSLSLPDTVRFLWLGGAAEPDVTPEAVSEFNSRYPHVTLTIRNVREPLWVVERRRIFNN